MVATAVVAEYMTDAPSEVAYQGAVVVTRAWIPLLFFWALVAALRVRRAIGVVLLSLGTTSYAMDEWMRDGASSILPAILPTMTFAVATAAYLIWALPRVNRPTPELSARARQFYGAMSWTGLAVFGAVAFVSYFSFIAFPLIVLRYATFVYYRNRPILFLRASKGVWTNSQMRRVIERSARAQGVLVGLFGERDRSLLYWFSGEADDGTHFTTEPNDEPPKNEPALWQIWVLRELQICDAVIIDLSSVEYNKYVAWERDQVARMIASGELDARRVLLLTEHDTVYGGVLASCERRRYSSAEGGLEALETQISEWFRTRSD